MKAHAYCDGSGGSPRGSSCACVIVDPKTGEVLEERSKILPKCSNNVAEYEGLILALETASEIGVRDLKVHSDSQLIVNQVNETWKLKAYDLNGLRTKAWEAGSLIQGTLELIWVRRNKNKLADALCTAILDEHFPKGL